MKVYQIHINYMEPVDAAVTLYAESEEDAINIVRKQWGENGIAVTIVNIEELADLPSVDAADLNTERKIN